MSKLWKATLLIVVIASGLRWLSAIDAKLSASALEERDDSDPFPEPYRQKVCFRVACQVQACLPKVEPPDIKFAETTASCLFADPIGDDCGSVVSGIGYPQSHTYLTCPPDQQLRQFQYDIWRAIDARVIGADVQLPTGDSKFPIRAYGTNCTNESGVKCDGKTSLNSCNGPAQCKTAGCRVNSTDYGGCDFKY